MRAGALSSPARNNAKIRLALACAAHRFISLRYGNAAYDAKPGSTETHTAVAHSLRRRFHAASR
jgi:hypothetical protein